MNHCLFVGRLTRDPELKNTANGKTLVKFGLALQRRGKDAGADFIDCVAWNKTAEFIEKHFKKGSIIGVHASAQQESWEKEGVKHTRISFSVHNAEFVPGVKNQNGEKSAPAVSAAVADEQSDDNIPF